MILQTGGRSLGATSTRSRPASRAASRALLVGMTPSMTPSALMTRTGEMRICSLTLIPRSIGPIASSSGTRIEERLARAVVTGGGPEPILRRHQKRPPRPSPVVASQTYPLRSVHRVVKVWFDGDNANVSGRSFRRAPWSPRFRRGHIRRIPRGHGTGPGPRRQKPDTPRIGPACLPMAPGPR